MQIGWIKLHRGILEWEWYDDHNTTRLFLHCLIRANHKPTNWRGHNIDRGQFVTSLDTLSAETGLSVSQIRTSIRKLESTGEMTSKSQARSRVITVIGYDSYQSDDKQIASKLTGSSQADDKLMTTDKNDKNENNENKLKAFEHWYSDYPKKSSKKKAVDIWLRMTKGKDATYIEDLTNHIANDISKKMASLKAGDKTYFGFDGMHPTTYLNQERFNDE